VATRDTQLISLPLQINERVERRPDQDQSAEVVPYCFKTVNGDLAPWRLRPRLIPLPAQAPVKVNTIRSIDSADTPRDAWQSFLTDGLPLTLPPNSTHQLDLQAECHSTAFIRWTFRAKRPTQIKLKLTYSEGYELTPRQYPWLRTKADRLDAVNGQLLGPFAPSSYYESSCRRARARRSSLVSKRRRRTIPWKSRRPGRNQGTSTARGSGTCVSARCGIVCLTDTRTVRSTSNYSE
jgi:hypothetical protein